MSTLFLLMLCISIVNSLMEECIIFQSSAYAICANMSAEMIPAGVPSFIKELDFSHNNVPVLKTDFFEKARLPRLESLDLSFCGIQSMEKEVFSEMSSLKKLNLSDNNIERIMQYDFHGSSIHILYIERNNVGVLEPGTFKGLEGTLRSVSLKGNMITTVHPEAFEGMKKMTDLNLDSNMLMAFRAGTFRGMPNLQRLSVVNNTLYLVYPGAFEGLVELKELHMDYNIISQFRPFAFRELSGLKNLTLSNNKLRAIQVEAFFGLTSLASLSLRRNRIFSFENHSFKDVKRLDYLDMSQNPIGFLTSEIISLPNLSFVDVSGCKDVKVIAKRTGRNLERNYFLDIFIFNRTRLLTLNLNGSKSQCNCDLYSLWEFCNSPDVKIKCNGELLCSGPDEVNGQAWDILDDEKCYLPTVSVASSHSVNYVCFYVLGLSLIVMRIFH